MWKKAQEKMKDERKHGRLNRKKKGSSQKIIDQEFEETNYGQGSR